VVDIPPAGIGPGLVSVSLPGKKGPVETTRLSETKPNPAPPMTSDWHPHQRPKDLMAGLARDAMGVLLANPYFDRVSLWALTRYFFPLSRLWAAATASEGVPERFLSEVPLDVCGINLNRVQKSLFATEAARAAATTTDRNWEDAFFGGQTCSPEILVALEAARRDGHHALNVLRRRFRYLLKHEVPPVRYAIPSPEAVAAEFSAALQDRTPFFAPPDPMPRIETSRRMPGTIGTEFWLRFTSPSPHLGDRVYARVHEPDGVKDPPTLIFGHGICVEFDMWRGLIDEVADLCRMGIRVIRPEAPWHGRRRPIGMYSGEPIVATAPLGPLQAFTGAIREWSVLIDWARQTGNGAVAIGGSSLGALMSLLCADISRTWPDRLRPEAMLVITHCGRQRDAWHDGTLAQIWKPHDAMTAKGWSTETSDRYLPILDPDRDRAPVMTPENIVSVLGRNDRVTPYQSGLDLLNAWRVPPENRFLWRRGHFSVPMTLIRDTRPLHRFAEIMARL